MYLVDTSVWVDYIRGNETPAVECLDDLLRNPIAVGINNQIYLEILQGARSEAGFRKLQRYFSTPQFYHFDDPLKSHEAAAFIYFQCRSRGITARIGHSHSLIKRFTHTARPAPA